MFLFALSRIAILSTSQVGSPLCSINPISGKRSAEPESANGTSRPNRRQQAISAVRGEPGHLRTMGSATHHNEYIFVWPCFRMAVFRSDVLGHQVDRIGYGVI